MNGQCRPTGRTPIGNPFVNSIEFTTEEKIDGVHEWSLRYGLRIP